MGEKLKLIFFLHTTAASTTENGDHYILSETSKKEQDISQHYQIFPDEILGSGQFGIVYGGMINSSTRSQQACMY